MPVITQVQTSDTRYIHLRVYEDLKYSVSLTRSQLDKTNDDSFSQLYIKFMFFMPRYSGNFFRIWSMVSNFTTKHGTINYYSCVLSN